ncbi:hypothetical protein HN873_033587, partial [Arachis hypogaea]
CLVKPPVKEITQPIDLQLHSDVRAMDRAEFDHQVAEKLSLFYLDLWSTTSCGLSTHPVGL